jgi:hypothetical protein
LRHSIIIVKIAISILSFEEEFVENIERVVTNYSNNKLTADYQNYPKYRSTKCTRTSSEQFSTRRKNNEAFFDKMPGNISRNRNEF